MKIFYFAFFFFTTLAHYYQCISTLLKGKDTKCLYKILSRDEELRFSYLVSSSDQDSIHVLITGPENTEILNSKKHVAYNLNKIIEKDGEHRLCFTSNENIDNYVTYEFSTATEIGISQSFAKDEIFKDMAENLNKLIKLADDIYYQTSFKLQRQTTHKNILSKLVSDIWKIGYFKLFIILGSFAIQIYIILSFLNNGSKVMMSSEDRSNPFFQGGGL
jgi:hypothetical protein